MNKASYCLYIKDFYFIPNVNLFKQCLPNMYYSGQDKFDFTTEQTFNDLGCVYWTDGSIALFQIPVGV
jgi:hypothetical protein